MIDDFLDANKIIMGTFNLFKENFNVLEICEEVIEL